MLSSQIISFAINTSSERILFQTFVFFYSELYLLFRFYSMDICVIVTFFLHFRFRSQRFLLLYNTSLLQRLLIRKNGVLFMDLSNCCDGLLSSQRLLLKTNCENSLLVNRSNDVKIDSIYSQKFIIKFLQEISEILKNKIGG